MAWLHTWIPRRGRLKKRWIDHIREDCMDIGIPIQEPSHIATNRERWRNTVHKMGYQSLKVIRNDFLVIKVNC